MTETSEPVFDLTKKKKKKISPKTDEVTTEANQEEPTEPVFDTTLKKKKKPRKTSEETEEQQAPEGSEGAEAEFMASLKDTKKKKKKKTKTIQEGDTDRDTLEAGEQEPEGPEHWIKTDRDYKYTELLQRVFDLLKAKNPELTQGRTTYKIKAPQILREGTRKTVFANFQDICKSMHRQPEHVLQFLLAELGTSGSIDGNERLVIKGRFLPKGIETVLRRYITEFVVCSMCKGLDTTLARDPNTRLYMLQCSNCNATRTVTAIKQGFVAVVTKRKKM